MHFAGIFSPNLGMIIILQCFDAVGWTIEKASGLLNFCCNISQEFIFGD